MLTRTHVRGTIVAAAVVPAVAALLELVPAVGPGAAEGTPVAGAAADTAVYRSTSEDRESVSITVYNQDFGLVRETRSVDVGRGIVALEFGDVASKVETETVHVRPLAGPEALRLLEQNYRYDLLNPTKLLEKYVGRTVKVYPRGSGGEGEAVEAEVLSVDEGVVLRIGDEITFDYPGRFAFPRVPEDLISRPTLVWLLESRRAEQRLEASYLSRGLGWEADYVMLLDDAESRGDLSGWVTLTNQSGASWTNAELKLVAGEVRRVSDREEARRRPTVMEAARAARDEQFREEAFFEYHLYTLQRPTTLRNNEQKQVTLLEADAFGLDKRLVFRGEPYLFRGRQGDAGRRQDVGVYLEFRNSEDNGLGMPLPGGVVRVYKEDASGAQQFVGEDRVDHTPRDETVRIKVGEAFDVVAERRQTDYEVLGSCSSESAWEIQVRNHKEEDVSVEVVEPASGDWEIVSASHRHEKLDQQTFVFRVDVPAGGEETVTYRVRVRWC